MRLYEYKIGEKSRQRFSLMRLQVFRAISKNLHIMNNFVIQVEITIECYTNNS